MNFHAHLTGSGKSKFLILSKNPSRLSGTPGVRLLTADADGLAAWLEGQQGQAVADAWGVAPQLVSRLKKGLGLGFDRGGNRRAVVWQERPPLPIQVLGQGQRQTIIVGPAPEYRMSQTGNILIEDDADLRQRVKVWLENHTVDQAAETLSVARNVALWLRKELGVSGRPV